MIQGLHQQKLKLKWSLRSFFGVAAGGQGHNGYAFLSRGQGHLPLFLSFFLSFSNGGDIFKQRQQVSTTSTTRHIIIN